MSFSQSLTSLFRKIRDIRIDCINAFDDIGQSISVNTKISEIPESIRHLKLNNSESFMFIFDFNIDQIGSPQVPRTGRSVGGLTGINPSFSLTLPFTISDVSNENNISSIIASGRDFGIPYHDIGISSGMNNLILPKTINMLINQINKELNPNEDSLN